MESKSGSPAVSLNLAPFFCFFVKRKSGSRWNASFSHDRTTCQAWPGNSQAPASKSETFCPLPIGFQRGAAGTEKKNEGDPTT